MLFRYGRHPFKVVLSTINPPADGLYQTASSDHSTAGAPRFSGAPNMNPALAIGQRLGLQEPVVIED